MKQVNLFTSNLSGKQLISEKSLTKKAVKAVLANYEKCIDSAFTQVIKSDDRRARNVANAAKGKFKTALDVVAHCYPYQTTAGELATKGKNEEGVKVWKAKKLTAAAARGIVKTSLDNFTKFVGAPEIKYVVLGDTVEK
jgi:hypothetical protein